MSTKIYRARRLKKGVRLWPYVQHVRLTTERRIRQKLREFYRAQMTYIDAKQESERSQILAERGLTEPSAWSMSGWLYKEFRAQPFDMDVSVVFREHGGRIYFIPYASGIMRRTLDFLKRDRLSEDFHYQNQADQSAPCSRKAWEERGRIWDAILDHERDALVLKILCPGNFLNMHLDSRGRFMRVERRR